jgi:hypothetical protein
MALTEAFKAYADNVHCDKIFFAGSQRPSYLPGLSSKPKKVTLIQAHTMAPGLERISVCGQNKLPMALELTVFPAVFVPPQGQDLFRRNFGLRDSDFKSWLCLDSINVRIENAHTYSCDPTETIVGRMR